MKNTSIIIYLLLSVNVLFSQCSCQSVLDKCGENTLEAVNKSRLYAVDNVVTYLKNINEETIIDDVLYGSSDGNEIVAESTFTLKKCCYYDNYTVLKADQNDGDGITRKVLKIGDSLTSPSISINQVNNLFSGDVMDVDFIGTQGTPPRENEGHSGKDYVWMNSDVSSPFVFSGVFDFEQYLNTNNLELNASDWVLFQLGTNDIGLSGNCSALYDASKAALDEMIFSIKSYNPSIRIAVSTVHATALEDAAWINNYPTNWQVGKAHFQSCQLEWNERLIADYPHGLNNTYINPIHYALDCANDYPVDVNGDQSNAVHPALSGYTKIANYIYAFLKYHK